MENLLLSLEKYLSILSKKWINKILDHDFLTPIIVIACRNEIKILVRVNWLELP